MKKLLLTLGSAAAVVAPLATVVACGDDAKEAAKVLTPAEQHEAITTAINALTITSSTWEDKVKTEVGTDLVPAAEISVKLGIASDTFDSSLIEGWTIVGIEFDATADEFILVINHTETDTDYDITLSNIAWSSHKDYQIIKDAIAAIPQVKGLTNPPDWGVEPETIPELITAFGLEMEAKTLEDALMAGGAKDGDWLFTLGSNTSAVHSSDDLVIVFHHKDDPSALGSINDWEFGILDIDWSL